MKNLNLLCLVLLSWLCTHQLFGQDKNLTLRSRMSFPGQTLANICGWTSPDGHDYALLGANQGLIIVDVTQPDAPQKIVQIPGPVNLWKEIKTYRNFAYITSEGGQGVQIVDMSKLPSDKLDYHHYTGDGAIAGQLNTIHALHIDTSLGFLYLFGSNLASGGAVVCNIHDDPYNPHYVGSYSQNGYVHDGYVDKDTLYAGHIYAGLLTVVDMKDKSNPRVLGSVETPLKFTHNAWLTDDHRSVLITDERNGSYLTSYDCSDPSDMKELDRLQTTPGSGSIVHNTHIYNDWAISSWYTDGFNIVDAHRPHNLVETGRFDTWAGSGGGFDGCWGVYPYFTSGTIVASNIDPGELIICSPKYVRAAYFEGRVTDGCTGAPLSGVEVKILGGDQLEPKKSSVSGRFATGQTQTGTFKVQFSKAGYPTIIRDVEFKTAEVTELDIVMQANAFTITGTVLDGTTNQPLANAPVSLSGPGGDFNIQSDANGEFTLDCLLGGTYSATAGAWGFRITQNISVNANQSVTLTVVPGYYDDFSLDYGWTTATTTLAGKWTRGVPVGTTNQGQQVNPGNDSPKDANDKCYVTGNGGGAAGNDDVDNGSVTLTSPPMKLAKYGNAELSFDYWFYNGGGQGTTPNDYFRVKVTNGTETKTLLDVTQSASQWRSSAKYKLADYIALTDNVRIIFEAADDDPGHLVEAAVDVFEVMPVASSVQNLSTNFQMSVQPNPSIGGFWVNFNSENAQPMQLRAVNAIGQVVFQKNMEHQQGSVFIGENWQTGIYFLFLENENGMSQHVKLVKN